MATIRGDVSVTLDGKDYTLHPGFLALATIEERTGLGLLELAHSFTASRFKFAHIPIVFWAGMMGAKTPQCPSIEDIGDAILKHEDGFIHYAPVVREFLTAILQAGPKVPPGKEKGETQTQAPTTKKAK